MCNNDNLVILHELTHLDHRKLYILANTCNKIVSKILILAFCAISYIHATSFVNTKALILILKLLRL